jgi:tetratricopeptide (TPR) repeat protein
MSHKEEEMQDFIENVEDVCKRVDDILNDRVPLDEIDKVKDVPLDRKAIERKKAREEKARREEAEKIEKAKKGREGGGDKENYVDFCRKCKVEYVFATPVCVRCESKTISQKERKAELLQMVEKYKEAKQRKQDRKKKWELWKKTQAIFWKKTATNYEKWENFTDSEDEFEQAEKNAPPILPENDPNFKALDADLKKRAFERRKAAAEANELKVKANDLMRKKMYDRAVQVYSEAIELFRSNKFLWSNRALAYIKKGEFENAISDCTKMLEYAEVLEGGYESNREVNFKFFARRAMAYIGLKQYEKALSDIENAIKLIPEDKSAHETKKEILEKMADMEKLDKVEENMQNEETFTKNFTEAQLKMKAEVDAYIELVKKLPETKQILTDYDYFKLKDLIHDKDLKLYFYKRKGLDLLKSVLKQDAYKATSSNFESLGFLTFVKILCEEDSLYADGLIENKFVRNIIKRIMLNLQELFPDNAEKLDNEEGNKEEQSTAPAKDEETKQNQEASPQPSPTPKTAEKIEGMYEYKVIEIEEFLELLILMTENRSVRAYLRDKPHLLIPIFKIFQENLFPKFEKEHSVLTSAINLYSNLSMNDVGLKATEIRDHFITHCIPFIYSFAAKVLAHNQNKYLSLKNSCLAFIVNLSTDKRFRDQAISMIATFEGLYKNEQTIVKESDFNYVALFMQNLGICFNILFKKAADGQLKEQQQLVMRFYEHSTGVLLNLFFQLTDKSIVALMQKHFRRWRLDWVSTEILYNCLKFKLNMGILLNRFINVVAKLGFESTEHNNERMLYVVCELANLFEEDPSVNRDFSTDSIRFLASILQEKKELGKIAIELTLSKVSKFNNHIKKIISTESNNTLR